MPSSNLALALDVLACVDQVPHRTVLDIGPGYGKYGLLLNEYLNVKPERITAVEAEPTYLAKNRLDRHPWYDAVVTGDAADLPESFLAMFDVVLMVDVIEHIPKERAIALLDRIPNRVVILTPVDFFHQHVAGVPSEDHVSHWTTAEFGDLSIVKRPCEVLYENLGGIICRLGPRP